MNRIVLSAVAVATLGMGVLGGCGGDRGGEGAASAGKDGGYCADLLRAKPSLEGIEGGDLRTLGRTSEQIHHLADEAPAAVADDWTVLTSGFDQIIAAFEKVGLSEDEIVGLQDNELPADVDMAALQEAMGEIKELSTDEFTAAGAAIATHAEEACDIDLND